MFVKKGQEEKTTVWDGLADGTGAGDAGSTHENQLPSWAASLVIQLPTSVTGKVAENNPMLDTLLLFEIHILFFELTHSFNSILSFFKIFFCNVIAT